MKNIALNITAKLGEHDKLVLIVPPTVTPAKLCKWKAMHRAWCLHQLIKSKDVKTIVI
jgi:hypothetical protein